MWDGQVKKLERVAQHADVVADHKEHAVEVLRREAAKLAPVMNSSRQLLSSVGGWTPETAEAQRQALRNTMLDCMRREEMVRLEQRAEKERELAYRRADEAEYMRMQARMKVESKAQQEAEIRAHREEVEQAKLAREESGEALRQDMAKEKQEVGGLLAEARKRREEKAEKMAAERRVAMEAKAKAKKEADEKGACLLHAHAKKRKAT